jgi:hypothetical protein
MLTVPICSHVRAVISDGGPACLRTSLAVWAQERGMPRLLAAALVWLTLTVTSLRLGVNQLRFEPVWWAGKIAPRPIFFIHGDHDQYVLPAGFDALVAAAGQPKKADRDMLTLSVLPDVFAICRLAPDASLPRGLRAA